MKADLVAKLQSAMRGVVPPKAGVAGVVGVAGVSATCSKPLKLQRLLTLRVKNDKVPNGKIRGVVGDVAAPPEPEKAELEERKGMAMDSVPEPYLDAWARLQVQKPMRVSDADWRQAIDEAGRFLDQWGRLAVKLQWTAGEFFDVPRDNGTCGLGAPRRGAVVTG
jgi:hypothetical protein